MSYNKFYQIPLEVNWHEGMLLSQHHFQQNDLRVLQSIAAQIRLESSHHFGICNISVDKLALSDGVYRLNEIDAVFQDGIIFSFYPKKYKNLRPLEINLSSNIPADVCESFVFLCIAEASDDLSPVLGNPARYYSIEGESISDYNIKDNAVKIPRLFPNAFLHIGETVPEFCIGFPIAHILKTEGLYRTKDETMPCFVLEKTGALWQKCSALAASIREKALFLSEKMQNQSGSAFARDTEKILSHLLGILPSFEILIFGDEVRPYALYQQLAVILGSVSALVPTDPVPVIQPYNHNDIDGCTDKIIGLIEYYILSIERGYTLVQFNKKEKFYYHYLSAKDLAKFSSGKMYVGIRVGESNVFFGIEKWMRDAIIVSDFSIETVRKRRVKGAHRERANQETVLKILPGTGVSLFEIDIDLSFINSEQNLHIFNPGAQQESQPAEIILYIPREKVK